MHYPGIIRKFVFPLLLLVIFWTIGLFGVLDLRPQSVHQWAQCDRASVAYIFGTETLNIFEPQTHNIENGSGISGMEFPLINYSVGILYRIFGFHELIYRLTMMLIVIGGLIAAFEICRIFTNSLTSGLVVLIFCFSPVLLYYTPNFLPDAASMSFILVSWLYFLKMRNRFSIRRLGLFFMFTLAATTIKISSLISVIVMIIVILADQVKLINPGLNKEPSRKSGILIVATLLGVISIVVSWYVYANWLSKVHNSGLFLLKTTITFSKTEILDHLAYIQNVWWKQYYSNVLYYTILITSFIIIYLRKHVSRLLAIITITMWLGTIGFVFIMLSQFRHHDYYIITLLPVILFHLSLFADTIIKVFPYKFGIATLNLVLLLIALNGYYFSENNFNYRYKVDGWMMSPAIYDRYFDLDSKLTKLGISESAKVVSIIDDSPNITLYLMNRKGIPVISYEDENTINNKIAKLRGENSYILVNDLTYFEKNYKELNSKVKVGNIDGITILKNN